MHVFKAKCPSGCHGVVGLFVGPFQLEIGWDLDALKFGAKAEVHRQVGILSGLVFFGPFQICLGLRWNPFARPNKPA